MKFLTYCMAVFTLLTVVACGKKEMPMDQRVERLESQAKYKCIEGSLYERMGGDVWIDKSVKCVVSP